MKPKGSIEEEEEHIPGGKLLAQYCCRVMIAHWKSIHEGPKQKLERQLELFQKWPPVLSLNEAWCRKCGLVQKKTQMYNCEDHGKNYYCRTCLVGPEEERVCPECAISCDYDVYDDGAPRCKNVTREGPDCSQCSADLCTDHRQYCAYCGELFCKQGTRVQGDAIDCFDKHSCAQGRKRAKH
jgi:hypothetical protein